MDQQETYRSTLRYAIAIAGSELALSVVLKVPLGTLKDWLNGIAEIPTDAFLDAVEVIVRATPSDIARTRDAMRKAQESSKP